MSGTFLVFVLKQCLDCYTTDPQRSLSLSLIAVTAGIHRHTQLTLFSFSFSFFESVQIGPTIQHKSFLNSLLHSLGWPGTRNVHTEIIGVFHHFQFSAQVLFIYLFIYIPSSSYTSCILANVYTFVISLYFIVCQCCTYVHVFLWLIVLS